MSIQSPLGASIANLKNLTPARETRARLPAALDALIAAIFARIFARLEQIFLLWQSGTLPTPPIRRPQSPDRATAPHPAAPRTPHPVPHRANPPARARATIPTPIAISTQASPTTTVILSTAKDPRCVLPPHQPRRIRIRPARAPPPNCRKSPPCTVAPA